MIHYLPITPALVAVVTPSTDEGLGGTYPGCVTDVTDADRLALYLHTLALAAARVADRIEEGTAGPTQVTALRALSAEVIEAAREANRPKDGPPPMHIVTARCPRCRAPFETCAPVQSMAVCPPCTALGPYDPTSQDN